MDFLDFAPPRLARRTILAGGVGLSLPASALTAPGASDLVLRPAYQVAGQGQVRWTLAERMARYRAPGVSIAVVQSGALAWARGFGLQAGGGAAPVGPHTLFQAASIGKVVSATAALAVVQDGRLDLDLDVNHWLKSWKVPENAFTARKKVTLRRILSHRAGLTVHGFFGYAPDQPMPTILDVLEGRAPARNDPVRVDVEPGTVTRYSGGGFVVEQLLLSDVTGEGLADLAYERVFSPLGMTDSTFAQPLPASWQARAARGHDSDGRPYPGGWRIGPELAAGWLWTTPSDLCRWAIGIEAARRGSHGPLGRAMAQQMLTHQDGPYGLGPLLEGEGRTFRFGHGGNNPGYRAQLTYFPATGQGAAVMTNGDGGDLMIDEIIRGLAEAYQWPALGPSHVTAANLQAGELDRLAGRYGLLFPGATEPTPATIVHEGSTLRLTAAPILDGDQIVPVSTRDFLSPNIGYRLVFDLPPQGPATGFTLTYADNVMTAGRAAQTP